MEKRTRIKISLLASPEFLNKVTAVTKVGRECGMQDPEIEAPLAVIDDMAILEKLGKPPIIIPTPISPDSFE